MGSAREQSVISLITEYRKRHNLNCVMSIDEGVTFFDVNKKPHAIVLTSSHSRSVTNCRACLSHSEGLIGELFIHNDACYPQNVYRMVRHEHLEADVDLCAWANTHIPGQVKLEPFITSSERKLECWLWQFYIKNHPSYHRKWANKDEPDRSLEQIAWTIDKALNYDSSPRLFESFYKSIYYTFLLGRKYTIYG
jgi:hypothetical protein